MERSYVGETGISPISQRNETDMGALKEKLHQAKADEKNARKGIRSASGKL